MSSPPVCKYVELPGVMEVRTDYDDGSECDPLDLFDFLKECPNIPEDYTLKNQGEQSYFYCLICRCDMRSVVALRSHSSGKKHTAAALRYKRETLGLPEKTLAVPQIKDLKRAAPIHFKPEDSLGDILKREEGGEPVVGLSYVDEVWSASRPDRRPLQYHCSLPGCSSSWGNALEMRNHVVNPKHIRNYFSARTPEDSGQISSLTKNEAIKMALDFVNGDEFDEDNDCIRIVRDDARYQELKTRPVTWSEKKAKAGLNGFLPDSNTMPLGERQRINKRPRSSSRRSRSRSRSKSPSARHSTSSNLLGDEFKPKVQSRQDKLRQLEALMATMTETNGATPTALLGLEQVVQRLDMGAGMAQRVTKAKEETMQGMGQRDKDRLAVQNGLLQLSSEIPFNQTEATALIEKTQELLQIYARCKGSGAQAGEPTPTPFLMPEVESEIRTLGDKFRIAESDFISAEKTAMDAFKHDLYAAIQMELLKNTNRPEQYDKLTRKAMERVLRKEYDCFTSSSSSAPIKWHKFKFDEGIESNVKAYVGKQVRKMMSGESTG